MICTVVSRVLVRFSGPKPRRIMIIFESDQKIDFFVKGGWKPLSIRRLGLWKFRDRSVRPVATRGLLAVISNRSHDVTGQIPSPDLIMSSAKEESWETQIERKD